jgi:hypothetical protein
MATYPTTLPAPLSDGYQLNPVEQVIRTDMESGYARTRRRTTARIDKFSISFVYTSTQMDAFRDWFESSSGADGGAAWFDVTLITGDGSSVTVEARFTGMWQATYRDKGLWQVVATIEVRYA